MRPSWQIDFKWVFALALLAAVLVSGVLYSLAELTEREPATGAFAGVMSSFAKEGGDPEGYADIQAAAAANPDLEISIDRVTFPIKGSEIAGLSYDEAIDLVILRLSDILYTDGPEAVEGFFESCVAHGMPPIASSSLRSARSARICSPRTVTSLRSIASPISAADFSIRNRCTSTSRWSGERRSIAPRSRVLRSCASTSSSASASTAGSMPSRSVVGLCFLNWSITCLRAIR